MSGLAVNNQGRPEARNVSGARAGLGCLGLLGGFVTMTVGLVFCSKAQGWGFYGPNQMFDLALYQKGYILAAVGGGLILGAWCVLGCPSSKD